MCCGLEYGKFMFRYIQFLLSFVQFMFSSIQHRIIWLHWFIFCTNSAYFCQEFEIVDVLFC